MARARAGSSSRSAIVVGDGVRGPRVDDVPGDALLHRLRRAAGGAGDDRPAAGGGLEEDHAQALDVQPGAAGAAGHGEDVAGGVVRGQLRRRPPAR